MSTTLVIALIYYQTFIFERSIYTAFIFELRCFFVSIYEQFDEDNSIFLFNLFLFFSCNATVTDFLATSILTETT